MIEGDVKSLMELFMKSFEERETMGSILLWDHFWL